MFWRNSKDRIGYVAPKYTNVGDEKARGWDMQLRKQFNKNISTFVGYTHTIVDATAQRAANVDGYVPKGAWNIGVDYDEENLVHHCWAKVLLIDLVRRQRMLLINSSRPRHIGFGI